MSDIILGDGVFSVGDTATALTAVALTRGGGSFAVEREFRVIEADGDYGPVKGRIRVISEIPKLTLNALEKLETNMLNFYPALKSSDTTEVSGNLTVATTDYKVVAFTGATLGGRNVYIQVDDAINLENIEWDLVDKEEVVPEITFTGTYKSTTRTTPPYKIVWST